MKVTNKNKMTKNKDILKDNFSMKTAKKRRNKPSQFIASPVKHYDLSSETVF